MYKLIALDLDGTLLDSNKNLSDENIKSLKEAIRKGVRVIICSGRVYSPVKYFADKIGTTEPLICANGSVIKEFGTGDIMYLNNLPIEKCIKAIDICHKENIYFHVYIDGTAYTERIDEYAASHYWKYNSILPKEYKINIQIVENINKVIYNTDGPILKIVGISENNEKLIATRKQIEQIDSIQVTSSSHDNFEAINLGVDKATALKFLCNKYNISNKDVIAMGDNENDIPMIKFAGLGIAMANGCELLKNNADYVTLSNNENGVSEAIKKFVL